MNTYPGMAVYPPDTTPPTPEEVAAAEKDPAYDQPPVAGEPSTAYPEDKIRAVMQAARLAGKIVLALIAATLVVVGVLVAQCPGPPLAPQ